jgi:ribosomal protein L16 Arg81 hydroxylase
MEQTVTAPTARTATQPEVHSSALAGLLGEAAAAEFLAQSFGREAYRSRVPETVARALFGWPQLNTVLAEHRFAHPRLKLERDGADITKGLFQTRRTRRGEVRQDLNAAVLNERLRQGATLIIDAVNEISGPLRRLCASLAAEFTCSSQANLYACWGTTKGFDVHWDDHDVFVIQLEGRKRWALYGPTRAAPTHMDLHAEPSRPETAVEIVLEPGDLLYLPRGYWHAAVGLGGPTLHLTIGLTRKTGGDFLHWLADHALADEAFRADLPFEQGDQALGQRLAGLLETLAGENLEVLARLYRRHVEAAQAQRPQLSFPFIGEDTERLAADARLELTDGAARLAQGEPGEVVLSWRGTEFRVCDTLQAPLEALIAHGALSYAEFEAALPAAQRPELPAFVGELVRRGALLIHEGPQA